MGDVRKSKRRGSRARIASALALLWVCGAAPAQADSIVFDLSDSEFRTRDFDVVVSRLALDGAVTLITSELRVDRSANAITVLPSSFRPRVGTEVLILPVVSGPVLLLGARFDFGGGFLLTQVGSAAGSLNGNLTRITFDPREVVFRFGDATFPNLGTATLEVDNLDFAGNAEVAFGRFLLSSSSSFSGVLSPVGREVRRMPPKSPPIGVPEPSGIALVGVALVLAAAGYRRALLQTGAVVRGLAARAWRLRGAPAPGA